jgi:hypothetical protein
MEPNPYLVFSSTSYIVVAAVTYATGYQYLGLLYYVLTFISMIYHATKWQPLLYLDYPLLHTANVWTLACIYPGGWRTMPYYCVWFAYITTIYYYGYLTKSLIWSSDLDTATRWHMSLHISSALFAPVFFLCRSL